MTISASNRLNSNFHFAEMSLEFPADFGVLPIYTGNDRYYNDEHCETLGRCFPRKRRHFMKYVKQFGIILVISLIGELLNFLLPLPIPASIYGLVLMLGCLQLHIIPLSEVKETSAFLIEIMPLMFIPAAVGLITSFDILKAHLAAYLVITVVSTFLVMLVSGHVTQLVIRKKGGKAA